VRNGVPFLVAFGDGCEFLNDDERVAMSILFSEFEGGKFDFDSMSWKRPE
jgi:hypothetical protein